MEEAIYLSKLASSVTVIHRRDTLRASKVMQDKARSIANIQFIWNTEVVDIKDPAKGEVTGLVLQERLDWRDAASCPSTACSSPSATSPNTKLVEGQLTLDESGYIVTHGGTRTSVPGVFAAGDVQDHIYRQAVTAAGTGCMAAIDAERFLSGLAHETPVDTVVSASSLNLANSASRKHRNRNCDHYWSAFRASVPRSSVDPAPAHNHISVVEDHCLTGRDRTSAARRNRVRREPRRSRGRAPARRRDDDESERRRRSSPKRAGPKPSSLATP